MNPRVVSVGTVLVLSATLLVGCSFKSEADVAAEQAAADRFAGVTACKDYMGIQKDLRAAYDLLGDTTGRDARRIHIREIERLSDDMADLADEAEADGHEELAGHMRKVADLVDLSGTQARLSQFDAMQTTGAEMIYAERPILETCDL